MVLIVGCGAIRKGQLIMYKDRVDPVSITNNQQFDMDCNECIELADKWQRHDTNEALGRTLLGALLGAAAGAAVGGAVGGSDWVGYGAGVGAVEGGVVGGATTANHKDEVFFNCMRTRGYLLLW